MLKRGVEFEWRVLFAAILAGEKCKYRIFWSPVSLDVVSGFLPARSAD